MAVLLAPRPPGQVRFVYYGHDLLTLESSSPIPLRLMDVSTGAVDA